VQEHPLLSGRYRVRFVGILFLVCFLNLADRTVFSVVAPMIRVELKLSDTQLGMLQGLAFALLYGGLGIPVGWLAERYSRVRIIALATAFWSAATALSGVATSFGQMLLTRIGVGTGEAGFTAPTSSLVADHFPRERRATGMSLIMLGLPIGAMVGALLAGMIAQHWGWRAVFFCFGIPGILVACATWFGLIEPPRGLADGTGAQRSAPPPLRVVWSHLWNTASLRWVVIGGSICSIGIQGVAQFMVLYFVRSFGMPIRSAAALFGILSGLSLATGLVLGAFGTDRASSRDARWWVIAPAVALVLTTACFVMGFRSGTLNVAVVLIGLGCVGAMIHYGPTVGLIQNLTPVNMRSSVSAVFAMLYRIASGAFAQPHYVEVCRPGSIAPAMAEACAGASRSGLIGALTLCVLAYAVAAIFYALASRTLREDLNGR
jgi:MFS family permease